MIIYELIGIEHSGNQLAFKNYRRDIKSKDQLISFFGTLRAVHAADCLRQADQIWRDQLPFLCCFMLYRNVGEQFGIAECGDLFDVSKLNAFVAALPSAPATRKV